MLDDFDMIYYAINLSEYIIYKNQIILINYSEYRKEQKSNQKREHYGILWKQHAIYAQ